MTNNKQSTILHFAGGHGRDLLSVFSTLVDTDYWAIETATVRSGQTALRCTKGAGSSSGLRHVQVQTYSGPLSPTIVVRIVSHTISSGNYVHWATTIPTSYNWIPDLAWYYDGTNLKLAIRRGTTTLWTSTQNFSTGIWYIIRFVNYNPLGLASSDKWRGIVSIYDTSAAELDRSPAVWDAGPASVSGVNQIGMGVWAGAGSVTSDQIDYIVDTFSLNGGGVFGPIDIKTAPLYPDTDGPTHTSWDLVAGTTKVDAVDDPASGAPDDDTTYIISDDSLDLRQTYSDSGGSGITLSGSETVMSVMPYRCTKVVGTGLLNTLLYDAGSEGQVNGASLTQNANGYQWVPGGPYQRRLSAGTARAGGDAGSGWTVAAVDALEFGVIRGAGASNNRRMTACFAEVLYGLESPDVDLGLAGELIKAGAG